MGNRRSRAHSSGGKNYVWVAARVRQNLSTTIQSDLLVTDTDWSADAGQRSATIIAMRGYLGFASEGTTSTTWALYIGVSDADAPSASPDIVDTYVEEDIMFTHGGFKAAGVIDGRMSHSDIAIDVKAKRKIKTGDNCRIITFASATTNVQVFGIIRTLLLLNNG